MYIQPDSTIRILKDVPLDPTYDHTIYFTSKNNQTTFFQGKSKYTLNDQTYQRVQRGYIRCEISAENLYDCNYIMFQNTAFGTKWFYAFIKSVEYINNNVSQIEFEIDVMQTWFFDYTLDKCFVEREHSSSDNLFENLVAENVDLGNEYVCNGIDVYNMNAMSINITAVRNPVFPSTTVQTQGVIADGVYSCLDNWTRDMTDNNGQPVSPTIRQEIDDRIDSYRSSDQIVLIYQYPTILKTRFNPFPQIKTTCYLNTTIDGHIVRNKKLFSYPYNYILASNNSGKTAVYKWELFSGNYQTHRAVFETFGVFLYQPAALCFPRDYAGQANNYDAGIEYTNFPVCAWTSDPYKDWFTRNSNAFAMSILSGGLTAVSGAMGLAIGNVPAGVLGLTNAFTNVASSIARIQDIKNTPPQTYGKVQTDVINSGLHKQQFDFRKMSIKKEFAEIIDDYFDRFGYATKRNKVPNRNVRPHWCYTKTAGCTLNGSIPCDDAAKICSIYNNGITFWKNGNEVGDYSLNNQV